MVMENEKLEQVDDDPIVLIVDDEEAILLAVRRQLRRSKVKVVAAISPSEAISVLSQQDVAVMISDYMMPGMNGLELLALVRRRWPKVVGIMMTACDDIRVAADAVNRNLVKAFITKPWDSEVLRRSVEDGVRNHKVLMDGGGDDAGGSQALAREIELQATSAAFALARAVDARDEYTHRHSEKVALYAVALGKAMGLPDLVLEDLRIGGLLHDLGKIGVPDQILLKPGKLTDEEYAVIKRHPQVGASIVEPMKFSENIHGIIRHHHENYDGTGYPDGLGGGEILLPARIVHLVDAYEAMTSNRVYRDACDSEYIRKEFLRCRASQFDPQVTDAFVVELEAGRIEAAGKNLIVE